MNDLFVGVVGVHAAKPQIDHDVLEFEAQVLRQICSVLRDSPVRFAIARTDILSRTCIRRIFPNISMVITLFAPAKKVGRASKTPGSVLNRHNL